MDATARRDTIIGNSTPEIPILANEGESMVDELKPVPAPPGSASISVEQLLALLQTDFFDLQSKGLKMLLTGTGTGRLGIMLEWPGHTLGFSDGHITVNDKAV